MPQQIIANTAAVATGQSYGAAAGFEMLREGGNAVDAAVAAMIALSVVIPGSVGLGGYGGSAVIFLAGSHPEGTRQGTEGREPTANSRNPRIVAIDFDSRAPLGFRDGLVTADPQSNYYGARSVTVPAVVAGLDLILREFGTKSWREVSQPAIRLAEEGFEFDAEHKRHLDRCAAKFDMQSLAALFPSSSRGGTRGGVAVPQIGDRWRQPDLARLLRQLADYGPASFYEGEVAQTIVRYLRDRGGILTEDDFHSYRPQIVDAVHATCRAFELYTPPPPSGGITSLGIVQTVECLLEAGSIEPWSGEYFHLLAEAAKLCWQERHQYLGDPDFIEISLETLVSEQAAQARAEQVRAGITVRGAQAVNQSPHTANSIAADAEGNLISLTATQGWMYGSHLVVDGMGLVLNHGMSRFDYRNGHPNVPAAGKRMQHNMAPMIVLRKFPSPLRGGVPESPSPFRGGVRGGAAFAFGLPGGPKIVSVTAQLALNTIAFGATPAESIAAPRLHTEGNEPLLISSHMQTGVVAELEKAGHTIRREDDMGGPVNALAVDPQTGHIDIASGETTGAVAGF